MNKNLVSKYFPRKEYVTPIIALSVILIFTLTNITSIKAESSPDFIPPAVAWSVPVEGTDVAVSMDGNPVIIQETYSSSEYSVVKLNQETGEILWSVDFSNGRCDSDDCYSISSTPDGHVVLAGTTEQVEGSLDFLVAKLDGTNGEIIWNITYDSGFDDYGDSIVVGLDGNPIVVGISYDSLTGEYGVIRTMKLDGANGTILWNVIYSPVDNTLYLPDYMDIIVAPDGDPIIVGNEYTCCSSMVRIIKYEQGTGIEVWSHLVPMEIDQPNLAVDLDGNPIIAGVAFYNSSIVTAKIDQTNGLILWSILYGENDYEQFGDIAVDDLGNPIITGSKTIQYAGNDGNLLWSMSLEQGTLTNGKGISLSDGSIYVTGEATVKYEGKPQNILWVSQQSISQSPKNPIAVGNNDNPIILGYTPSGLRVSKLLGASGLSLWEVDIPNRPNVWVNETDIAIGSDGNPYIIEAEYDYVQYSSDIRIMKLGYLSGDLIWDITFENGQGSRIGDIAIGTDGNPVIIGASRAEASSPIVWIAKFNGNTGVVEWISIYPDFQAPGKLNISIGSDNNPVALASLSVGSDSEYVQLFKVDGNSGTEYWSRILDTGYGAQAQDIAIGIDGNPVVVTNTGTYYGSNSYVRKISGVTGAILWELAIPAQPYFNETIISAVAYGVNGNLFVTGMWSEGGWAGSLRTIRINTNTGEIISHRDYQLNTASLPGLSVDTDGNPIVMGDVFLSPYSGDGETLTWVIKYLTDYQTPAGTDVSIDINGGLSFTKGVVLTYPQVTEGGYSTFFTSRIGPDLPSSYVPGTPPLYFYLNTTAHYDSPLTGCINYDPIQFSNLDTLQISFYENGDWYDITSSHDATNHIICGTMTELGTFVLSAHTSNLPPIVDAGGPYMVNEGDGELLTAYGNDPDGDEISYAWDLNHDGTFETPGQSAYYYGIDGPITLTVAVMVSDNSGLFAVDYATVQVVNIAPNIIGISAPIEPVQVNTLISTTATFVDPGTFDTHSAIWNWGDGTTSGGDIVEINGSGYINGSHSYPIPGVYTITLTVTDDDYANSTLSYEYIVVYDPTAGFVTGGGWIDSPEGAYVANPLLSGNATFGFVSKYLKRATVPEGNTEFQFQAADFNFRSSSYQWLIVTGSNYARFKGAGTINGYGEYFFILWAGDGTGIDGMDTFRIKIWEEDELGTETVIYDNGMDQAISSGSIIVHTK